MLQASEPITIRFLCLARNCAGTLPQFLDYLGALEAEGIQHTALIGENGSSDGTRSILEAAVSDKVQILDTSVMGGVAGRLARMAVGRQALLEASRASQGAERFLCVADLDNVMVAPPSPASVRKALASLQSSDRYFAVGASSAPFYYDILSLQAHGHDYRTLNAEIAAAKGKPLGYFHFHKRRIYENQKRATLGQPWECASSFNGFCLYDAGSYYQGTYRAPDEDHVCEHVTLNLSVGQATGKRMLVMPELSLVTPPDHGPVSFFRFWSDRLRKAR